MLPVCLAAILAASVSFSGVQLRWAHRLKVYVRCAFAAELSRRYNFHPL
jgi:hypothetical protein